MPAIWQVYQKLYYNNKLKAIVDVAYTEYLKSNEGKGLNPEALKKERLSIQNRIVRERYEVESEEVKAEVERHREGYRNQAGSGLPREPEKLQK